MRVEEMDKRERYPFLSPTPTLPPLLPSLPPSLARSRPFPLEELTCKHRNLQALQAQVDERMKSSEEMRRKEAIRVEESKQEVKGVEDVL